ncbi:MAG: hypothetical protein ACRCXT_09010 [Paraclostridium sp.]
MDIKLKRYYQSRREPYIESFKRIKLYKEIKTILNGLRDDIESKYINSDGKRFSMYIKMDMKFRWCKDIIIMLSRKLLNDIGIDNVKITTDSGNTYFHLEFKEER